MASLPHDLLSRILADPMDASAWQEALPRLEALPLSSSSLLLRRLLYLFPHSGPAILCAARAYQRAGDTAGAEAILLAHLVGAPYPPLWAFYCQFVLDSKLTPALAEAEAARAAQPPAPAPVNASAVPIVSPALSAALQACATARASVLQAFRFSVERVGSQWGSEGLLKAFCAYAAGLPSDNAFLKGLALECQREALALAALAPGPECGGAWAAYLDFERPGGASNKLGEANIARLARPHALALAASRERAGVWAGIDLHALPRKDVPAAQVAAWRAAIAYEAGNPLQLEGAALAARVEGVYKAALQGPMRACPEVWYEHAVFAGLQEGGGGREVLQAAVAALPGCVSMALGAAEALEGAGLGEEAGGMLCALENELGLLACLNGGLRGACAAVPLPPAGSGQEHPLFQAMDAVATGASLQECYAQVGASFPAAAEPGAGAAEATAATLPLRLSRLLLTPAAARQAATALPHVFILHQRQAQRLGGAEAARAVFSTARRSPFVTPAVFLASARLEYYCCGRGMGVPRNVIEAARKRWPMDVPLLLAAADLVLLHDDLDSARGFLKGLLLGGGGAAALPQQAVLPLWERYLALELNLAPGGGSLEAVAAVEARLVAADPQLAQAPLLCRMARRWGVLAGVPLPDLQGGEECWARQGLGAGTTPAYLCAAPMGGSSVEGSGSGSSSSSSGSSSTSSSTSSSSSTGSEAALQGTQDAEERAERLAGERFTGSAVQGLPAFLREFLGKLPAWAEELGAPPSVDEVISGLVRGEWMAGLGEEEGEGGAAAAAEQPGGGKRARVQRWG